MGHGNCFFGSQVKFCVFGVALITRPYWRCWAPSLSGIGTPLAFFGTCAPPPEAGTRHHCLALSVCHWRTLAVLLPRPLSRLACVLGFPRRSCPCGPSPPTSFLLLRGGCGLWSICFPSPFGRSLSPLALRGATPPPCAALFVFAACSRCEMPPAGAAVGSRLLLAVITPLTSVLLRASDASSIAQQLLAMEHGSVLACLSFASSEAAMCWLTNPDAIAAVSAAVDGHRAGAVLTKAGSSSWLAVIGQGARACFEIDTSGVGGAVQLMQTTASTLCVAASFSAAAEAYLWLAKDAGVAMQRVLMTTVPESAPPAENLALPAPVARSPMVIQAVPSPLAGPSPGCSSPPAADVSPIHKRARIGRSPTSSSVVTSSTLSGSCRGRAVGDGSSGMPLAAGASPRAGPLHGGHRYGTMHSCVSTATATTPFLSPPPRSSGGAMPASPCPCGADACLAGATSSRGGGLRVSGGGPSFQSANVARKRSGPCGQDDGPSDGKNPKWVAPGDPGRGTFTRESIHRMVAESVATWDQQDLEEGLRRDAALATQRLASTASPDKAGCTLVAVASSSGDQRPGGAHGRDAVPGLGASPSPGGAAGVSSRASQPPPTGQLTRMAAERSWIAVFQGLFDRGLSTFVTGGPGVGKTSFLRAFSGFVRSRLPISGAVVVVAPTGSAAKTAKGVTYHSFFGFLKDYKMQLDTPVQEAARLLALDRWRPIKRRLAKVEVLMIDEISMVSSDNLDVMCELLRQSRRGKPPAIIYTFGDFLQLRPTYGKMAFEGHCWPSLFGAGFVELTRVHRQDQPDFIAAIHDARFGRCTDAVQSLMDERSVTDESYEELQYKVLHIMPRHEDVDMHNEACLRRLCAGAPPIVSIAIHQVKADPNRGRDAAPPDLVDVSAQARDAALLDCVAPRRVEHCLGARVMLTSNHFLGLGLYHGSIGYVVDYEDNTIPVLRFENHEVTEGTRSRIPGVRGAGVDWVEVCCPPVEFDSRILSRPGVLAVRVQVPFVLGWGITVHRSQSLTLSEAVLDVGQAFGSGMVLAAMSRVPDKRRMHVRSFCGSRVIADPAALQLYRDSLRL